MSCLSGIVRVAVLLYSIFDGVQAISLKAAQNRNKTTMGPQGVQCYNCLSYDTPGCWDPHHPDYVNATIPNIDCHLFGVEFVCIVITAESATLVDDNREIGAVRVRTCVPSHKFTDNTVSYPTCEKLSQELAASEVFSRVKVVRPSCVLCENHYCTAPEQCEPKTNSSAPATSDTFTEDS